MYLGSWGLVTLIITSNFLQNSYSFLLGAISTNNSNPFPFQAHFKWVHDLLPLATQTSIPPFEQLSKKRVDCVQKNISENMHEHSFFNIISGLSSNYHHAQLRSCVGLSLDAWFYACPIIPSFRMAFDIFSSPLHTKLGLFHPMVHGLFLCICGHAIDLTWIPLIITTISGYCVDGICNLAYVIIVDPTHANFVLRASFWGVVATIAI